MQITIPPNLAISDQAYADAYTEGVRLERARIIAILDSDEAKDRPAMAQKLALTTDMPAEAAAAFMADLPAEKPKAQTPPLAERHAAAGGGAGYEGPGGAEAAAAEAKFGASIMKKAAAKVAAKRSVDDQEALSPMRAAAARVAAARDEA